MKFTHKKMKRTNVIVVLFFLLAEVHSNNTCGFTQSRVADQPNVDCRNKQKEIVGRLTGQRPIEGYTLGDRHKDSNKKVVRAYLSSLIDTLSIEPQYHKYVVPDEDSTSINKTFQGTNIYAKLPATTSGDKYVILGAHYDTVEGSPGGNDNATGIALMYCVFKELTGTQTRNKNIILVFFDEEEKGLIGSKVFAKMVKERGINVHSVHTVDQMGWDEDNDKAVELELPPKSLEKIYKTYAKQYDIPIHVSDVDYTDHRSFRLLGFEAIGLTESIKTRILRLTIINLVIRTAPLILITFLQQPNLYSLQ